MVVSGGHSRLQRGVPRDDRISPARCSEIRVQLQSLDFTETTGAHHLIKLQYTKHEVHTASCNAAVVDLKVSYGLSDRRWWWDGAVDCCLPSIGHDYWRKYWTNTNTTQYQQVLANIQYPSTGIIRTLLITDFVQVDADSRRSHPHPFDLTFW